jgi:hypothetical protein
MLKNRRFLLALALSSLTASLGMADIMNIFMTGDVNGSGTMFISCATVPPGGICSPPSFGGASNAFSFDDPGTSTASLNLTKSGQASATADGRTISANAEGHEIVDVTASGFSMDMHILGQVVWPVGSQFVGNATASETYTLAFDLSTGSFVQLTGSLASSFPPDVSLQLSGPGGVLFSETTDATTNLLLFLQPGHYSLSYSADVMAIDGRCNPFSPPCSFQNTSFANLSLNAALVPEPCWTAIVPAILLVACCLAARKRRSAIPC